VGVLHLTIRKSAILGTKSDSHEYISHQE